ncbi:hypothetical protein [Parasutterella muris]|uniref:Uncharacterized protein n=1 Tax=Parasutterella muris TaxID=2565572 RepID=A0A6L6YNC5_9BURK|nr:hypothetical protein [Parasutterella muris]MVX56831.1 hypothetical protein [Parasutterella muris]
MLITVVGPGFGTEKTDFCRALAQELGYRFVSLDIDEFSDVDFDETKNDDLKNFFKMNEDILRGIEQAILDARDENAILDFGPSDVYTSLLTYSTSCFDASNGSKFDKKEIASFERRLKQIEAKSVELTQELIDFTVHFPANTNCDYYAGLLDILSLTTYGFLSKIKVPAVSVPRERLSAEEYVAPVAQEIREMQNNAVDPNRELMDKLKVTIN